MCDRERIRVHTAFTGYPDQPREIRIDELIDPEPRELLRWVFTDPVKLRPEKSTAAITAEATGQFAGIAAAMRSRGLDGQRVAHFLVQCLFCMFAEDEELLLKGIFTGLLANVGSDPAKAARCIEKLFAAMQKRGGDAPLAAHYTDTGTIEKLIQPLISEPLQAEWDLVRVELAALAPKFGQVAARGKGRMRPNEALQRGFELFQGFLARLNAFRVLDPAYGSGNFLYLALKALRDIEKRLHVEATELGLPAELAMQTGPNNILGLEINEFAAELARVTVWIGGIQWCRRNGYPAWLRLRHEALDRAVAAAYGWTDYQSELPDDELLRRLLALNLERAGAGQ